MNYTDDDVINYYKYKRPDFFDGKTCVITSSIIVASTSLGYSIVLRYVDNNSEKIWDHKTSIKSEDLDYYYRQKKLENLLK